MENWKFTGSFDNYQAPLLFKTFIKWIITGPNNEIESDKRGKSMNKNVDSLTQILSEAVKSKRQMKYKPSKIGTKKNFHQI